MRDLTGHALETARLRGASYADIRIVETETQHLMVRNGAVATLDLGEDVGFGVRVVAGGAWGFAASHLVGREEIQRVAAQAVQIAKASATLKRESVRLCPEPVHEDRWQTPVIIDPFAVPLTTKLDLLMKIDAVLRKDPRIVAAESTMDFVRIRQWLATSEGSFIDQTLTSGGAGYSATAAEAGEVQTRSFPNSFRGQHMSMGYELIGALPFIENAERVRNEAVMLLSAKQCPRGETDLILDGQQLCLQIHESAGHASELDRVLGMEEDYAGTSFLTLDKRGSLRYGSDLVNLVADTTVPGGLGTRGYDDDGVRAKRWHIVQNGLFVDYQFNREVAHAIGAVESSGNCRADGWGHIPIIRITNLNLMPGEWTLDGLIADTKDGVFMETNKSWSIDQKRLNFQFGCEIGWEIKNGRRGQPLKNPTYQGITPQFWNSCDAICDERHWTLWGLSGCGKGQPGQSARMSHGAAPARFRGVEIGLR